MTSFLRSLPGALLALLLLAQPLWAVPFSAMLATGEVEVSLRADEESVSLERDFHLTISTVYPFGSQVVLPEIVEMRGRFQGFTLAEGFRKEPERMTDGKVRVEERWRLVPEPAGRCRLAPFAIELRYPGEGPASARSLATTPVLFPVGELKAAAGDVEVAPEPFWIAPTLKSVFGWIVALFLAAALLVLVLFLVRRIRRAAKLLRLSPSERAYAELEALLRKDLPRKGLFKDFYIELTRVVRRYIERSHGIRAPEQTTEEFLAAVKGHPRFSAEVVARLGDFLRLADLVKFARRDASTSMTDDAVRTARDYIETDAKALSAEKAETSRRFGEGEGPR